MKKKKRIMKMKIIKTKKTKIKMKKKKRIMKMKIIKMKIAKT